MSGKFSVGDRVVVTGYKPLMGKTGTIVYIDGLGGENWNGVVFDEPSDLLHDLFRLGDDPLCENHHGYWLLNKQISLIEDDVSDIEVGNLAELIGGF